MNNIFFEKKRNIDQKFYWTFIPGDHLISLCDKFWMVEESGWQIDQFFVTSEVRFQHRDALRVVLFVETWKKFNLEIRFMLSLCYPIMFDVISLNKFVRMYWSFLQTTFYNL